jgi:uncharacterized membrane protein
MSILWSILTSKFAGPIATALCIFLGCLLLANLAANGKLKAQVKREHAAYVAWHNAALKWEAYGRGEKASYDASEALRTQETTNARQAVSEANGACSARIREAVQSTKAIRGITHAPVANCNARPIVDTRSLSDALAVPSPGH